MRRAQDHGSTLENDFKVCTLNDFSSEKGKRCRKNKKSHNKVKIKLQQSKEREKKHEVKKDYFCISTFQYTVEP